MALAALLVMACGESSSASRDTGGAGAGAPWPGTTGAGAGVTSSTSGAGASSDASGAGGMGGLAAGGSAIGGNNLGAAGGAWEELPGTSFADAGLVPEFLPKGSGSGSGSILSAWTSAAVDTTRAMLVLPRGGGHADWAGNQVVGLDLYAREWVLLAPYSTAYTPMPCTGTCTYSSVYSDGTPASVHTYDAVAYLPSVDRVWSGGGIYWSPGGESVPQSTFWWDPASAGWQQKTTRPGGYSMVSVWDPVIERLWTRAASGLWKYDPETDIYTNVFSQSGTVLSSCFALDEPGRALYRVYPASSSSVGVRFVNPDDPQPEVDLDSAGVVNVDKLEGLGCFWDAGRIVLFALSEDGEHGTIYTWQPGAGEWTRHDPADGLLPPAPTKQGMWKKFFHWGGGYWAVTRASENVWVFNPPWSGEG